MHELGIVFHIIRTVEDVARQNNVARIRRVTLQLGEVSGVVESYLQDCWKWAAAKSAILPDAVLTVETIPAVTVCEDCGEQYPTVRFGRTCPRCQSTRTHLVQGNEMLIKEIEAVEDEDEVQNSAH
ncbi:hydrogenase maturation nickel metallochaperone HypA [Gemmiger sp.]